MDPKKLIMRGLHVCAWMRLSCIPNGFLPPFLSIYDTGTMEDVQNANDVDFLLYYTH